MRMRRRLSGRRKKSLENSSPDLGSFPMLYVPIPSEEGKKCLDSLIIQNC